MMKFVNPFTAGETITNLERERDVYQSCYNTLYKANEAHRETNGELHDELTLAADNVDAMITAYAQQEQAVFFHMEERAGLLEVIDDLEEELEELADTFEDLEDECDDYVDCIVTLVSENQLLNELLVEGSAAYDEVVAAGLKMADGYDSLIEEARKTSARELDYDARCTRVAKEERDDAQQDLAIAERELEEVRSMYAMAARVGAEAQDASRYAHLDLETTQRELEALKLANTQSLSWVRQAAEALDAYGITIEDTPVGPTVQIDRDVFVNRIALDNVAAV